MLRIIEADFRIAIEIDLVEKLSKYCFINLKHCSQLLDAKLKVSHLLATSYPDSID